MKYPFGLALFLLVLGGLECSWSTSARVVVVAAEHLNLNKRARLHRRDLFDILGFVGESSASSSASSSSSSSSSSSLSPLSSSSTTSTDSTTTTTTTTTTTSVPGITSAVPPTSLGPDPTTSSSLGLLGNILGPSAASPTTTPPPDPSTSGVLPILGNLLPSSSSGGLLPSSLGTPPGPITSSSILPSSSLGTPPDRGSILPSSSLGTLGSILPSSTSDTPPIPTTSSSGGGILPILGDLLHRPSTSMLPTSALSTSSSPPMFPTSMTSEGDLMPLPSIVSPIILPSLPSSSGGDLTSAVPATSILPFPPPAPSSDPVPPPSSSALSPPPPSIEPPLPPTPSPPGLLSPQPTPTPSPPPSLPPLPLPSTTDPPTPPPTKSSSTATSVSINSDLSFVLTESSLAVASLPSSGGSSPGGQTVTDPDATNTDAQSLSSSPTPSSAFSNVNPSRGGSAPPQPPLPSGVPSRIYPANQQVPSGMGQDDMARDGYTLITLLFDQQLHWTFVVNSPIASSQFFAYIPPVIATAIGDPNSDRVKSLFLQVFVPSAYKSPADELLLGTLWVGYIPSDQVDTLEAMIKAKQSKFYTGVNIPAAQQLAARIRSGWGIRGGVGGSDGGSSSGGSGSGSGGSSGSGDTASGGDQQKARRDAIIGVVSSLGAIAVLVLAVLIVHSVKRRRELAHRRLVDHASVSSSGEDIGAAAAAPRGVSREFDRDSVGAPRRRSFYYAEDSLRGWEAEHDASSGGGGGGGSSPGQGSMTQRRVGPVVVPGLISAPILRESSMNW